MEKGILSSLYGQNLALLTDLYQLTMAYGYWKKGLYDREAVFHLYFRKAPFNGNFVIASGLELVIDFVRNFRFDEEDLRYLGQLKGADGCALFDESFLNYLRHLEFSGDIDAIPEGSLCFENQPLIRVKAPLLQAQLLESALLNMFNFSTLIATKAARITQMAKGDSVLEFGLRRAQGIDGGLTASRAAYIGGCQATSNVLAGKLYGIPVKGTHAHSWVMCYEEELEAFEAYAEAMPNNCIFLVDTYNSEEGIKNAIRVGYRLRSKGHELLGIRLDSGNLAQLSIKARTMLDEAGFPNAKIVASNDLDENSIRDLKSKGATISVWGIGTKLATAYDQPALGGVYKLATIRDNYGRWKDRLKISEQKIKSSTPGILQTIRLYHKGKPIGDVIYDTKQPAVGKKSIFSIKFGAEKPIKINFDRAEQLLVPVFKDGRLIYQTPGIDQIRLKTLSQLELFDSVNLSHYHKGLEQQVWEKKSKMTEALLNQFVKT